MTIAVKSKARARLALLIELKLLGQLFEKQYWLV